MAVKVRIRQDWLFGYGLVLGLTGIVLGLLVIHLGTLLNFGYPLLATGVGGVLYATRRDVYVAFVWWIWLFTPEVRRLVDYQSHYHNVSPVMLTPILVTAFSLIVFIRQPRLILKRSMAPFLFAALAMSYGLIIGAARSGVLPAVYEFTNWILPLGFGVSLMLNARGYAASVGSLVSAMMVGLVLIAVYGLYQFYHFPPWDAFWLQQANFTSAGEGESEQVRLFGPLNSPGPYGLALMISLVVFLVAKGPVRIAGGIAGFPAFGLSLVRSAWGAWAIAALFIIWKIGGKTRLRILLFGTIVALIAVPLVTAGPVADKLSQRFATLNNIQQDGSFKARQALYVSFVQTAFADPLGVGLGVSGLGTKLTTGNAVVLDSGLLTIPYEFGWVGGVCLVWAVCAVLVKVLNATARTKDRIAIAGAALVVANLSQNIFGITFSGLSGLTLWIPVALALGPVPGAQVSVRRSGQPVAVATSSAL